MGMLKMLLIILLIIVIIGSFFSIYKDITSSSNIKTISEASNSGYAIVGIDVMNANSENVGGETK